MAVPVNELKYWCCGAPFAGVQGVENTSNVLGEMKYWEAGSPYGYVFPAAAAAGGGHPATRRFGMMRMGQRPVRYF